MKNKLFTSPVSAGYKRAFTLVVMLLTMTSAAVAKISIGGLELKEAGIYQCSAGSDYGWGYDNTVGEENTKVELSFDNGYPVLTIYNLMVDAKPGVPALEISQIGARVYIAGACSLRAHDASALELGIGKVFIGIVNSYSTDQLFLRSNMEQDAY